MRLKFILILLLFVVFSYAQNDTIKKKKLYRCLALDVATITTSSIFLYQAWYKNYPSSSWHWFNDSKEWLQMDKCGHAYASYTLSSVFTYQLQTTGVEQNKALFLGTSLGFLSISTIEILDAQSKQWGASYTDLLANFTGSNLFFWQEITWKEQRIRMKYSFHRTPYAQQRPSILGENLGQEILKDYNGQTYWLSANISSFIRQTRIPRWLNIAVGYGAEGMITAQQNNNSQRLYYLSLDIDLTRIPIRSHFLRKLLAVLNVFKIPMPTIMYGPNGIQAYFIYF